MKTTLELNDELLRQARDIGRDDGVTLKSLVEQGLRMLINSRHTPAKAQVEPVVFEGASGFTDEFDGAPWSAFKDEARRRT